MLLIPKTPDSAPSQCLGLIVFSHSESLYDKMDYRDFEWDLLYLTSMYYESCNFMEEPIWN